MLPSIEVPLTIQITPPLPGDNMQYIAYKELMKMSEKKRSQYIINGYVPFMSVNYPEDDATAFDPLWNVPIPNTSGILSELEYMLAVIRL